MKWLGGRSIRIRGTYLSEFGMCGLGDFLHLEKTVHHKGDVVQYCYSNASNQIWGFV